MSDLITPTMSPADAIRLRNSKHQQGAGIKTPIAALPDEELIQTLMAHGQPRHAAEEIKGNPQLRLAAVRFWCDVEDARQGDRAAKERVDFHRECWSKLRAEEIISDDPRRGYGEMFDPAELLR